VIGNQLANLPVEFRLLSLLTTQSIFSCNFLEDTGPGNLL
jgi:hypothetical protein